MKSYGYLFALAIIGISVSGCMTPQGRPDNTASGALAGGAAGAIIGSTARHPGTGAAVGAAVGALAGGAIGHGVDQAQEAEEARVVQQREQAYQQQVQIKESQHPLTIDDVISMAKANISDDLIVSQIRSSRTVFHLTTADIVVLKKAKVSDRIVDCMINTPNEISYAETASVARTPPPPPRVENVVVAPGPDYYWIDGAWIWVNGGWSWRHGYWRAPYYSDYDRHWHGRRW